MLGGAREISSGVSIGIQPSIEVLVAKVEKELAAGYQRVKIKIKPGNDVEPARALRQRFPRLRLMVDANSAYSLEDALLLQQLDQFFLIMIEQPLLAMTISTPTPPCSANSKLPSASTNASSNIEHARAAIEIAACKIINMKLGRIRRITPPHTESSIYLQSKSIPSIVLRHLIRIDFAHTSHSHSFTLTTSAASCYQTSFSNIKNHTKPILCSA